MYLAQLATLAQDFQEQPLLWITVLAAIVFLAVILIPIISALISKKRIAESIYQKNDNFAEKLSESDAIPEVTEPVAEDTVEEVPEEVVEETVNEPEMTAEPEAESGPEKVYVEKERFETSDEDVGSLFDFGGEESVHVRRASVAYESLRKAKLKMSFKAKLTLLPDELKEKYSHLCNVIMTYKGVKEHMNRPADKFRYNKKDFLKFKIVGKKFNMFLAIDQDDAKMAELERKVAATKGFKKGQQKKSMQLYTFSIKNDKGWRNAESVIGEYMAAKMAVKETRIKKLPNIDFVRDLPRKSVEELLKEGEILSVPETLEKYLNKNIAPERPAAAATAAPVDNYVNPEIEKMREEIERRRQNEPYLEEVPVEQVAATVESDDEGILISETVVVSDTVKPFVAEESGNVAKAKTGRFPTVDLAQIAKAFSDGQTVTVDALKSCGLIPADAEGVKVLGNSINKALTIIADDFSEPAKQAIEKAGGKAMVANAE